MGGTDRKKVLIIVMAGGILALLVGCGRIDSAKGDASSDAAGVETSILPAASEAAGSPSASAAADSPEMTATSVSPDESDTQSQASDSQGQATDTSINPATISVSLTDFKDPDSGVGLKLPGNWVFTIRDGTVTVSDPSDPLTLVTFTFINNVTDRINAVGLADVLLGNMKTVRKDLAFTAGISPDADAVELDCTFTGGNSGKIVRGFYKVVLADGKGLFSGFETPDQEYSEKRDMLSAVMASLTLSAGLVNPPAASQPAADPNLSVRLVTKSGNGSTIDVPEDWSVTPFGLPGNLVALNAEGDSGYIGQTVAVFPQALAEYANGGLVSDYLSPAPFLRDLYLPALGNTNVKVEKEADASQILQGAEGAEAKVVLLVSDGANGIRQKTLAFALTMNPSIVTGQWSALVYGFWVPEDLFDSRFTLMTRIADSYKPNEAEIKRTAAENWDKYQKGIRQLSQSLSSQLESGYQPSGSGVATDETTSEDRLYAKWNDYAAGEERLYSETEDKVYTLPAGYDKYLNPEYPSEELTPIANDQWAKEVDRSYLPGGWHN